MFEQLKEDLARLRPGGKLNRTQSAIVRCGRKIDDLVTRNIVQRSAEAGPKTYVAFAIVVLVTAYIDGSLATPHELWCMCTGSNSDHAELLHVAPSDDTASSVAPSDNGILSHLASHDRSLAIDYHPIVDDEPGYLEKLRTYVEQASSSVKEAIKQTIADTLDNANHAVIDRQIDQTIRSKRSIINQAAEAVGEVAQTVSDAVESTLDSANQLIATGVDAQTDVPSLTRRRRSLLGEAVEAAADVADTVSDVATATSEVVHDVAQAAAEAAVEGIHEQTEPKPEEQEAIPTPPISPDIPAPPAPPARKRRDVNDESILEKAGELAGNVATYGLSTAGEVIEKTADLVNGAAKSISVAAEATANGINDGQREASTVMRVRSKRSPKLGTPHTPHQAHQAPVAQTHALNAASVAVNPHMVSPPPSAVPHPKAILPARPVTGAAPTVPNPATAPAPLPSTPNAVPTAVVPQGAAVANPPAPPVLAPTAVALPQTTQPIGIQPVVAALPQVAPPLVQQPPATPVLDQQAGVTPAQMPPIPAQGIGQAPPLQGSGVSTPVVDVDTGAQL